MKEFILWMIYQWEFSWAFSWIAINLASKQDSKFPAFKWAQDKVQNSNEHSGPYPSRKAYILMTMYFVASEAWFPHGL